MTLLRFPETELCPTEETAVLSVERGEAKVKCRCTVLCGTNCISSCKCPGFLVKDMPLQARGLQRGFYAEARKWGQQRAIQGFHVVEESIRVHGPWPSMVQNLFDPESSVFRDAKTKRDRSLVMPFVTDAPDPNWLDYHFVATVWKIEKRIRTSMSERMN